MTFNSGIDRLKNESNIMMKQSFIKKLIADGSHPFFVGGFVRDMLLGKDPKDIDIIVVGMDIDMIHESIKELGKINLVGESFAVHKFKPNGSDVEFDIAAPRIDKKIGTGHRGFQVISSKDITLEQDLERRDFTINSIAFDIEHKKLVDPFGGVADISEKLICATNPDVFIDDPLRILRAVQFAARFRMKIQLGTFLLMKKNIDLVKEEPGERIHDEFVKVFEKGGSANGVFKMLKKLGFHDVMGIDVSAAIKVKDSQVKTLGDFFSLILGHSPDAPEIFMDVFRGELRVKKQIEAINLMMDQILVGARAPLIAARMVKITPHAFEIGTVDPEVKTVLDKMKKGIIPATIADLEVDGNDALAKNIKGIAIGDALREIHTSVLLGELENKRSVLLAELDKFA